MDGLKLPGSMIARVIAGPGYLLLAAAMVAGLIGGVVVAASERSGDSRALVVSGLVIALPGLLWLAVIFGNTGGRLVRSRAASIELLGDRLVIHDRWLLKRPLEVHRSELIEISPVPQHGYWQYLSFSGRRRDRPGPFLDLAGKPNCELSLHKPRQFVEAVSTPLESPWTTLGPVRPTSTASTLLLRLGQPESDLGQLARWMDTAERGRAPKRPAGSGCLGMLGAGLVFTGGIVGFVLFCAGLAIDAS